MAWGRKKSGERREPQFGLAAALSELRLSPQDRVTSADDDKPTKKTAKRKAPDPDEDDDPRERKPRMSRAASAADPGARNPEAAAIDPDRRRRRQRAGDARRNGRRQRRAEGAAALPAERLHRHRGPPLLFASRRRPARHPARGGHQRAASRGLAGRLDAPPAARQEPVPDPGTHAATEIAGGRTGALAGTQAYQIGNSRTLSQPGLFRFRRLWRRGRRAAVFRQIGQERHAGGSRDARGPRQIAVAAR